MATLKYVVMCLTRRYDGNGSLLHRNDGNGNHSLPHHKAKGSPVFCPGVPESGNEYQLTSLQISQINQ